MINISSQIKAYIDIEKLRNNVRNIRKLLNSKELCAVVKANAYGHGDVEIANEIHDIVDSFAVATVLEGKRLRLAGITKNILCLIEPDIDEIDDAIFYNLDFSLSSMEILKLIENKKLQKSARIHLAIDTGMNRQGIDNFSKLNLRLDFLSRAKRINTVGIFSHLARADSEEFSRKQLKLFNEYVDTARGYFPQIKSHISASGGLILGGDFLCDMARVGILLYGYKPFDTKKIEVSPIMKVCARAIEIRSVKRGENLGYGDYVLKKTQNYALVRAGYGDGFNRKGLEYNLNNLCMDLSFRKFSKITSEKNFEIEILGDKNNADDIAKKLGTISYEVLTSVGNRTEKVYL